MLGIYESRHRLRLIARLGQALGLIALTLALFFLSRSLLIESVGVFAAALGAACIFLLVSSPRRIRFEEDGEEARIPAVALAFIPLHAALGSLTGLLERLSSANYTDENFRAEQEEELRSFVESESETGVIEEGEKEMINGVFGFHDSIVREVMVPRVDVAAVEQLATLEDLVTLIRETGHSRVPLYDETLDQILGVVYAKDLLQILVGRDDVDLSTSLAKFIAQEQSRGTATPFMHDPYRVPETKKIDELLHDLRASRTRLAIVFDEYGGTAGLVSTEDLVEEIVGDLRDEYDDEEDLFFWKKPGEILIASARLDIDDLNEMLATDLPSEGFETLGGFVYDHLGHVPGEGQTLRAGNLEMAVLKIEGQRISQVQITRLPVTQGET